MSEQELNIALSMMAEQRNTALDEVVYLKAKMALLQQQIVELTKPKEQ